MVEDRIDRTFFHHHSQVHHHHFISHLSDNTQIVGDKDDRVSAFFLQPAEQFQDLGLGRHVNGGGRLIGDQAGAGYNSTPWR